MTNVIAVNMDRDYDAIRAEEIQRGDNIEFPSNHPDVKWYVEEGGASKPPCNQPGVLWYVAELVEPKSRFQIRGHVPVRRYQRNHG